MYASLRKKDLALTGESGDSQERCHQIGVFILSSSSEMNTSQLDLFLVQILIQTAGPVLRVRPWQAAARSNVEGLSMWRVAKRADSRWLLWPSPLTGEWDRTPLIFLYELSIARSLNLDSL